MKKLLTILVVMLLPICMFGQQKTQKMPLPLVKYNENVKLPLTVNERSQIIEVYGEHADKYVFDNPNRLKEVKNILRNRVVIEKHPNKDLSSFKRLSEVPLVNDYNKNLQYDFGANVENFNPLKYNFNFFSRNGIEYYRIDNTQYLITILPQHTR